MSPDTLKTVFTYTFALVALIGSMLLLRFPPIGIPPEALLTFVVSITSASLGYVFGERSAASAVANQPTVTTSAGPPQTTTITPSDDGPVNG
jgi:hypothetical protein